MKEFKTKYEYKSVVENKNDVSEDPIISVCVQTYQHADYIEDCLKGILMQETDFKYEILLGEDASSDGTREICIKYAKNHPDKIRLFLHHRENNIKINGSPTGRFNFLYNLYTAKGKYIALCEGDDYWTDPYKLQKQVDFLEANPDLAMCTHEASHQSTLVNNDRNFRRLLSIFRSDIQLYGFKRMFYLLNLLLFNREQFWFQKRTHDRLKRKAINTLKDFENNNWYMPLCSILMHRKVIDPLPECYFKSNGGHQTTLLLGAMNGGVYHIKEIMAVKRDQESSVSKDKKRKKRINELNKYYSTNDRIQRYQCLKKYAKKTVHKEILEDMLQAYIKKNKIIDDRNI